MGIIQQIVVHQKIFDVCCCVMDFRGMLFFYTTRRLIIEGFVYLMMPCLGISYCRLRKIDLFALAASSLKWPYLLLFLLSPLVLLLRYGCIDYVCAIQLTYDRDCTYTSTVFLPHTLELYCYYGLFARRTWHRWSSQLGGLETPPSSCFWNTS